MAKNIERLDELTSFGLIYDEKLVCQYIHREINRGIFYGDNPFGATTSMLTVQIVLMFILTRITHFLLSPCHQTYLVSQIVAGIILGPVLLGRNIHSFDMLFPATSILTLSTFAEFGMIIYFFKMGVEVNTKQLLMMEKRAVVIGLLGHISSIVFGIIVVFGVEAIFTPFGSERYGIFNLVIIGSLTSFPAISNFLSEMNILNSEIGRMALSTSLVCDACMWLFYLIIVNGGKAFIQKTNEFLPQLVISVCYFILLFFMLRPLVIWISNRNPKGKPMTESHFVLIICVLMLVGYSAQVTGQPSFVVAFWFGLVLPEGPPLGSILAERLDIVGSTFIVPAYCTISGLRTCIPDITGSRTISMTLIFLAGYIGKFVGTLLPSLHFQIEFWDSLVLSLIMCCKGLMDLCLINVLLHTKAIGELAFTMMIYTMVAITGFSTLIVFYIYDPSRRYKTYIRRSIKGSQNEFDLKILVCIHNEENVYPMINLLQASNPTNTTPLSIFVLHLMELSGRAASILRKNDYTNNNDKSHSYKEISTSEHINNVFNQFLLHNQGCVTLQCFTAIAPYTSMHDDICYMAMDTKSNLVIVPYHKQWSMDQNFEVSNASIRTLNQKALNKSPCSVGILIDRSEKNGKISVINEKTNCEVAMIFLGGADDQEALAYGMRIAEHSKVRLTVIWVRFKTQQHKDWNIKNPYIDLMERAKYTGNLEGKVYFKEEIVEDGEGTAQVIRRLEGRFNFVIVGRHHIVNSPCTLGLTEWCELPELGPLGNLLAMSDFTFSVLVVQQQPFNNEFWYVR